mmetsp:Transcript_42939/g.71587  ORF Transcript_42939/g.71587 Transcript_42939/m.71587 type:complete len:282 (-) Transcript_42939:18-863(-)
MATRRSAFVVTWTALLALVAGDGATTSTPARINGGEAFDNFRSKVSSRPRRALLVHLNTPRPEDSKHLNIHKAREPGGFGIVQGFRPSIIIPNNKIPLWQQKHEDFHRYHMATGPQNRIYERLALTRDKADDTNTRMRLQTHETQHVYAHQTERPVRLAKGASLQKDRIRETDNRKAELHKSSYPTILTKKSLAARYPRNPFYPKSRPSEISLTPGCKHLDPITCDPKGRNPGQPNYYPDGTVKKPIYPKVALEPGGSWRVTKIKWDPPKWNDTANSYTVV